MPGGYWESERVSLRFWLVLDWTRRAVRPLWVLPSRVPKIAQKSKKDEKKRTPENASTSGLKLVFSGTPFDHLWKKNEWHLRAWPVHIISTGKYYLTEGADQILLWEPVFILSKFIYHMIYNFLYKFSRGRRPRPNLYIIWYMNIVILRSLVAVEKWQATPGPGIYL